MTCIWIRYWRAPSGKMPWEQPFAVSDYPLATVAVWTLCAWKISVAQRRLACPKDAQGIFPLPVSTARLRPPAIFQELDRVGNYDILQRAHRPHSLASRSHNLPLPQYEPATQRNFHSAMPGSVAQFEMCCDTSCAGSRVSSSSYMYMVHTPV